MAISDQIREIESAFGFNYPPSFLSALEEIRRAFPQAELLLSSPDIQATSENIPERLFPFLRDHYRKWPEVQWSDIYAFDLDSKAPEFRVVVWCDHAIVMDWDGCMSFLQWIRENITKPSKS